MNYEVDVDRVVCGLKSEMKSEIRKADHPKIQTKFRNMDGSDLPPNAQS
jgi:hypothetical protein